MDFSSITGNSSVLSASVTCLRSVGAKRAELLRSLGIATVGDLLNYTPRTYVDISRLTDLTALSHGQSAVFFVEIIEGARTAYVRKGLSVTTSYVKNLNAPAGRQTVKLTWYNQPFGGSSLVPGEQYYCCGKLDMRRGIAMVSPKLFKELPGILPVYTLKSGISAKIMRSIVSYALELPIVETLPDEVLSKHELMGIKEAYRCLHFPKNEQELSNARRRILFDGVLKHRVATELLRSRSSTLRPFAYNTKNVLAALEAKLPFSLTKAQRACMRDIEGDLHSKRPMNRLVQGDVGSGKTMVGVYAMMVAANSAMQSALLAPTEILATQHYLTLCKYVNPKKVVLLTGGLSAVQRREAYSAIESGSALYIVGTHAIIQESLQFHSLALAVIDEQQRFGVRQRAALKRKGICTDTLILTATPIPRTLALIMYGDLDVSTIDELPFTERKIITRTISDSKRGAMYDYLLKQAKNGEQLYVVCPLIGDDDTEGEQSTSASAVFRELADKYSDVSIILLHGKMKAAEKLAAIDEFKSGEAPVMVSTTVIEVGVDVPAASNMVVEGAEMFGLSQLHQLRGRVGRSGKAGGFYMLTNGTGKNALELLCRSNDGFEIAECDFNLRGPGELLGNSQHGFDSVFSQECDMRIVTSAALLAESMLKNCNAKALESFASDVLSTIQTEIILN